MDGGHLHPQQQLHHGQMSSNGQDGMSNGQNGTDTECLPEENVSIVEDISNDEKLESMKSIVNGTMRRKLYFNPAYFEPHLLVVRDLTLKIAKNIPSNPPLYLTCSPHRQPRSSS